MDGRSICTPRWVSAWPFAEPSASWAWNSRQPNGSLSMNCTRVGPREYISAVFAIPSSSKRRATTSVSLRNFSRSPATLP